VRRFGLKTAIVAAGIGVAAGTIHRTTYVSATPLVARVVAAAPKDVKTPWGTTPAADSSIAPGGLDAGVNHARIAYWVNRLSTTLSADFTKSLERKSKYSDMIERKLAAKKMPKDLVYLAMIESEFNPNAKSPVKALGLWQFMTSTARQFGLKVHGRVDERRDPARATDAALAYLSSLHDELGSWYLAAAAYNSGPGTVIKALRRVTGKSEGSDEDFFKILPHLPKETQDYVPKLIAAARIGNAPERYGLAVPAKTQPAPSRIAKTPSRRAKPVATKAAHKRVAAKKPHSAKKKTPTKKKPVHRTLAH
jgi:membrane-bound lytic murein transglycosylase MltF